MSGRDLTDIRQVNPTLYIVKMMERQRHHNTEALETTDKIYLKSGVLLIETFRLFKMLSVSSMDTVK